VPAFPILSQIVFCVFLTLAIVCEMLRVCLRSPHPPPQHTHTHTHTHTQETLPCAEYYKRQGFPLKKIVKFASNRCVRVLQPRSQRCGGVSSLPVLGACLQQAGRTPDVSAWIWRRPQIG
jgi:hypothetical protein